MIDEIWVPVEGFPDYAVSNYGRVRNVKFDRELNPRRTSYGHLRVMLFHEGVSQEFLIHRLVAQAFLTGYNENVKIKHFDDDNANNHVENLRFVKQRMGVIRVRPRIPYARRLRIIETGEVFRTARDCARHIGGDHSAIYAVLRGQRAHHMGYTFEYFEERTQE